jgi:hypothetical protein
MEFTCTRCGYKTQHKCALQKHLKSVNPCDEKYSSESRESLLQQFEKKYNDDAKECEGCGQKFNSKCNYYAHRKRCLQYKNRLQNTQNTSSDESNVSTLFNSSSNQNNSPTISDPATTELLSSVKELVSLIKTLVDKPSQPSTSNTINNNVVQINQQNNINLNSFGKESHAHLTSEQMKSFIENREIVDLIKQVNFNPNVPENHNVKRITSSKDWYKNQFLSVYNENGEWTNGVKEKVLESLVSNGMKVIYTHFYDSMQSNPVNVTEESVDFTRWFNENFSNPKNFIKDVFALTLDDKFLVPRD